MVGGAVRVLGAVRAVGVVGVVRVVWVVRSGHNWQRLLSKHIQTPLTVMEAV